jgi:hypothetical protein
VGYIAEANRYIAIGIIKVVFGITAQRVETRHRGDIYLRWDLRGHSLLMGWRPQPVFVHSNCLAEATSIRERPAKRILSRASSVRTIAFVGNGLA